MWFFVEIHKWPELINLPLALVHLFTILNSLIISYVCSNKWLHELTFVNLHDWKICRFWLKWVHIMIVNQKFLLHLLTFVAWKARVNTDWWLLTKEILKICLFICNAWNDESTNVARNSQIDGSNKMLYTSMLLEFMSVRFVLTN